MVDFGIYRKQCELHTDNLALTFVVFFYHKFELVSSFNITDIRVKYIN